MKRVEILPALYRRIVIAHAVRDELLAAKAPTEVRVWAQSFVGWIEVESAMLAESSLPPRLGRGERETIEIAVKLSPCQVLMDDRAGRNAAEAVGLFVSGTLAVLLQASRAGLLDDLDDTLDELKHLGFRVSRKTEQQVRQLASQL